jgi:folate-dependent phosphoribosylglycinamide formyltransferase PurN
MEVSNPKIIIWCGDAPNQKALANKIADRFGLAGIVIDQHKAIKTKKRSSNLFALILDRLRFKKIYDAWKNLMKGYNEKYPAWPDAVPLLRVPSVNDKQTANFTNDIQPDLVIVSGTGLVKEPLVSLPLRIGIINLHTGLSPFVKGGPNCTNWCIANNEWHMVGNTIMWLNAGIDSGNIITTETVDIRNAADLTAAHQAVMEHAHDLYCRSIQYLLNSTGPYNSVAQQSIDQGTLYLTKMWTTAKRKALLRNWKKRAVVTNMPIVKTVSLQA